MSTMSCLWKLIKFSVIMCDCKNGAKMSFKICVATRSLPDVYVYSGTDHRQERIGRGKRGSAGGTSARRDRSLKMMNTPSF